MNVTIDFETVSATDLPTAGAWRYAECPTTAIICLAWSVEGGPKRIWKPGDDTTILAALAEDPECIFIAHNVAFEKAIWRNIMVALGFPDIPNSRWRDTMAVCAYKAIPLSLEQALRVFRLPAKDTDGSALATALSRPNKQGWLDHSNERLQRVYDYCKSDVEVEEALHDRLGDLPPGELENWLMDQEMNERGLLLDRPFIEAAIQVVEKAKVPLLKEFEEITGLRPTQRDKVLKWLEANGCKLPDYSDLTLATALGVDSGADEVEDDRQRQDDEQDGNGAERFIKKELKSHVRRALEIRRLSNSSSVKKLDRMLATMCADGRVRGHTQYHGTAPGRPSGRLFQPLNFPRGTITVKDGKGKPDPEALVSLIMTGDPDMVSLAGNPIETVVSSLRHAIIAAPGHQLVSGDYAGIQARVVLALAGEYGICEKIRLGLDVYCDMSGKVYGRPITKKDKDERQLGKGLVLGAGFGMGWERFIDHCWEQMELRVDPDTAAMGINLYRKEWAPGVPKLWAALMKASTKAVWDKKPQEAFGIRYELEDGWLSCRLPSGRKIWYWHPTETRSAMPWDENDIRPGWTYLSQKGAGMGTSRVFGGLLTENVVMGIERDIMAHGKKNLEREGFPLILEVYDEALCEVREDRIDKRLFRQCMMDVPKWARQLQIPVDVPEEDIWVGKRYRK